MSEIDQRIHEKYDIKKRLGKGAYGIVWKAQDKQTKIIVAVKKIFDAFRNQTDAQRTFREIWFLQHFNDHPNIVKLLGLERAPNDKDIYLIFEFLDMDLHSAIKKKLFQTSSQQKFILYQILLAIDYIHSADVLHRDLKPSNILLNDKCQVRVADFGLARSLSQLEGDDSEPALTEYVATRWYRAPEILLGAKKYTKGVDIWSVGCILGEMLLQVPLFQGTSTLNQLEKIMVALPYPISTDIESMSSGYASAVLERAANKPKRLLTELLPQESRETIDFLSKLLALNPKFRLAADQAMEHPYLSKHNKYSNFKLPKRLPAVPPYNDHVRLTVEEYRDKLYQMIRESPGYKKKPDVELEKKVSQIKVAEVNNNNYLVNFKREIYGINSAGDSRRVNSLPTIQGTNNWYKPLKVTAMADLMNPESSMSVSKSKKSIGTISASALKEIRQKKW